MKKTLSSSIQNSKERKKEKINTEKPSRLEKNYSNDTIYTIGYQGRDWDEFLNILKENNIDILIDVRKSAKSQNKPEFNKDVLRDRLEEENIEYIHKSRLGVDYLVQEPYKDNWIEDECFKDWYNWWVREKSGVDLAELTDELKEKGKPALMCLERYPTPTGGRYSQDIYCHRHHLAELIMGVTETNGKIRFSEKGQKTIAGKKLFPKRKDL